MIRNPFQIFDTKKVEVTMFMKEDDLSTDQGASDALAGILYASLRQVHGSKTIIVRKPTDYTDQADGMITDQKDLLLIIRIADCQPLVIVAQEKGIAGVLHAGWRGLNAGAITEFYKVMKKEWDILPSETSVAIGPSLCLECADFTDPKNELPNVDPQFIHGKYVDLRGAADSELVSLGVPISQIERHTDCTRCKSNQYWTYRGNDKEAIVKGKRNMLACRLV